MACLPRAFAIERGSKNPWGFACDPEIVAVENGGEDVVVLESVVSTTLSDLRGSGYTGKNPYLERTCSIQ